MIRNTAVLAEAALRWRVLAAVYHVSCQQGLPRRRIKAAAHSSNGIPWGSSDNYRRLIEGASASVRSQLLELALVALYIAAAAVLARDPQAPRPREKNGFSVSKCASEYIGTPKLSLRNENSSRHHCICPPRVLENHEDLLRCGVHSDDHGRRLRHYHRRSARWSQRLLRKRKHTYVRFVDTSMCDVRSCDRAITRSRDALLQDFCCPRLHSHMCQVACM